MLIFNQNGTGIVNSNRAANICIGEGSTSGTVFATYPLLRSDDEFEFETLGKYSSPKRAKKVLRLIYETAAEKCKSTFEMPQDNDELDGTEGLSHQHCEQCYRRKNGDCPYRWQYRPAGCTEYELPF